MANALVKDKTLTAYTPGTPDDPGFPGQPGTPERVTYEVRPVRYEALANTMNRNPDGTWTTPLDRLRLMVGNPGLTATAAHYSDVWGSAIDPTTGGLSRRVPLSWTNAWVVRNEPVRVVVPATPAVPARPPRAGTPARSAYDYHFGWGAGANSVERLPAGWSGTATFHIGKPVGVVAGFALASAVPPAGQRTGTDHIRYGVVVGDGMIRLREAGITTKTLATATGSDDIKVTVRGKSISWTVNGALKHTGRFEMGGEFALDAALYAGDDAVEDPVLAAGADAGDGADLALRALRLGIGGDGSGARLKLRGLKMMASEGEAAYVSIEIPAFRGVSNGATRAEMSLRGARLSAAEQGNNATAVLGLQRLTGAGGIVQGDDAWVPSYSIASLGMLPLVASAGIIGGQVMDAGLVLPSLSMRASQNAYGEARPTLRPLSTVMDVEAVTPVVRGQELVGSQQSATPSFFITLAVSEVLGAAGGLSIAASVAQVEAAERISAANDASTAATIVAALVEQIGLAGRVQTLTFRVDGGVPVLAEEGAAWVVNTDSNATTRYESYSFNSFMAVRGKHFGVRDSGVFLLEGEDDAGAPIEAGIALGKHDFGGMQHKHIEAVYAGVSAAGQLFLKVKAAGCQEYTYRARRVSPHLQEQRFDPGRGLRANYFEFDLVNAGGAFDLDSITFSVVFTKRSI